MVVQIIWRL